MPFVCRQLKPMTEADWKAHYADAEYATVRSDEISPTTRVETCWVGWVSVVERPPRPFLVRVVLKGEKGWVADEPTWHATEAEALEAHERELERRGDATVRPRNGGRRRR